MKKTLLIGPLRGVWTIDSTNNDLLMDLQKNEYGQARVLKNGVSIIETLRELQKYYQIGLHISGEKSEILQILKMLHKACERQHIKPIVFDGVAYVDKQLSASAPNPVIISNPDISIKKAASYSVLEPKKCCVRKALSRLFGIPFTVQHRSKILILDHNQQIVEQACYEGWNAVYATSQNLDSILKDMLNKTMNEHQNVRISEKYIKANFKQSHHSPHDKTLPIYIQNIEPYEVRQEKINNTFYSIQIIVFPKNDVWIARSNQDLISDRNASSKRIFNQYPIEEFKELIYLHVYSLLGVKVPHHFISKLMLGPRTVREYELPNVKIPRYHLFTRMETDFCPIGSKLEVFFQKNDQGSGVLLAAALILKDQEIAGDQLGVSQESISQLIKVQANSCFGGGEIFKKDGKQIFIRIYRDQQDFHINQDTKIFNEFIQTLNKFLNESQQMQTVFLAEIKRVVNSLELQDESVLDSVLTSVMEELDSRRQVVRDLLESIK